MTLQHALPQESAYILRRYNVKSSSRLYPCTARLLRLSGCWRVRHEWCCICGTICTQMYFRTLSLHLLEHWLGQKSGRTHRRVTARRGILYLREKPFKVDYSQGPPTLGVHFVTAPQDMLVKNQVIGSSILYATVSILCLNPYITNTMFPAPPPSPFPPTHTHTHTVC